MPSDSDINDFVPIGAFLLPDAKQLMAALASAHIEFRAEFYDGISRTSGSLAPGYGMSARVYLSVDDKKLPEVEAIQTRLFGEFTP